MVKKHLRILISVTHTMTKTLYFDAIGQFTDTITRFLSRNWASYYVLQTCNRALMLQLRQLSLDFREF